MNASRVIVCLLTLAALGCNQIATVGRDCQDSKCGSAGDTAKNPADCGTPACASEPAPSADTAPAYSCVGVSYPASRKPLDIYLLVDDSTSMFFVWEATRQAAAGFFTDPASEGVSIALRFFGTECDAESYAQPTVAMAPLPMNAPNLQAAFPTAPLEETPTRPALQGAIKYAREWALSNPEHKVVVLLVTDGLPEECDSTLDNVTQVASDGLHSSPAIPTLVVGLDAFGDFLQDLTAFALAGGTTPFSVNSGNPADIQRALARARDAAEPCEFTWTQAAASSIAELRLQHSAPDGLQTVLEAVGSEADCTTGQAGFYFDGPHDPHRPTRAVVCPERCAVFAMPGQVALLTGCSRH